MKRTNAKVLRLGLEERVFDDFSGFTSSTGSGCGLLARSGLGFGGLVIETRMSQHSRQSTKMLATKAACLGALALLDDHETWCNQGAQQGKYHRHT